MVPGETLSATQLHTGALATAEEGSLGCGSHKPWLLLQDLWGLPIQLRDPHAEHKPKSRLCSNCRSSG